MIRSYKFWLIAVDSSRRGGILVVAQIFVACLREDAAISMRLQWYSSVSIFKS